MSRPLPQWSVLIGALLLIPFTFNACQGGLLGDKGFASRSANQSCVAQNGKVEKLPVQDVNVFADRKVKLRDDLASTDARGKALGPLALAAGEKLAVLADNRCLRLQQAEGTVSHDLSNSAQMRPDLDRQAYEWILSEPTTDLQIEDRIQREPCLIGLSWNREYKLQQASAPAIALNDPNKNDQSHLQAIRAEQAFNLFYGFGGLAIATGEPVVVAVIDSGTDHLHPDISQNIYFHSLGPGIDITTLAGQVDYNSSDISSIGHGTHVAGLIGAVANNSLGVTGAMPFRVKIMPIRLFRRSNNGGISTTSTFFYNALRYAFLNKAHVANLSIGSISAGPATDATAEQGVREAVAANMVVITVIGNADGGANGQEINGVTMSSIPGQYSTQPGVIGVGSFDVQSGAKSFFSHYSTTLVEIGAPGAEQGSTGLFSTLPSSLGSYGRLAGTSQAGPLVSAAAALTIGLVRERIGVIPSAAEVERLIIESAPSQTQLTGFFKNGKRLDLVNLAEKINAEYRQVVNVASSCQ